MRARTRCHDDTPPRPCGHWRFFPGKAALALSIHGLVATAAGAQLAVGRVEVLMTPDVRSSRDAAVSVRNESPQPVQAMVRLEDWDRAADGTNQWYPYGSRKGRGSCAPALSVFPQSLRLEPGAEQAIRIVLDSALAPPQECWAAAVVETVRPAGTQARRIAYVVRTAVKIYVQPVGLAAEGAIESLQLAADSTPRGSAQRCLEILFANTGQRHLVANGALEIRRTDNTVAGRLAIPTVYALPGARHAVLVPIPDLPPGSYVFLATMDYGGPDIAAAIIEHRKR